jgi:hypothetical protein
MGFHSSGFLGHGQSGNSGDQDRHLDPPSSNADIWFKIAPSWGQE